MLVTSHRIQQYLLVIINLTPSVYSYRRKGFEFWDPQQNKNISEIDVYSGSGNKWILDTFDATTGSLISSDNYLYSQILSDEVLIQKDLTNDGHIGDTMSKKLLNTN